MAESYVQIKPGSTGNKVRENVRTIGANSVRDQFVFQTARQSYVAIVDNCAFANSKQHFSIFNGSGSGKIVRISKLFVTSQNETAVSGGARRLDVKKITSCSGGVDITAQKQYTTNDDVPSQIIIQTGATVSEGALLFPIVYPDDEVILTQGNSTNVLFAGLNWMPEGIELQEYTLNSGEGFTIKQITNSTAGIVTWIVVFTLE